MIGVLKLGSNCPENLLRYRAVQPDIQAPLDPRHNFSADNRAYNTIWDGHNDTKPFRIPSISIASLSLSFEAHLGQSSTLGRWHFALSLRHRIFDQLPQPGPRAQVSRGLSGVCAGHFFVASSDSPVLKFTKRFFGLHAPNLLGHNRVVALQERLVYQTTTSQKCVSQSEPKSRPEQPRQTAT